MQLEYITELLLLVIILLFSIYKRCRILEKAIPRENTSERDRSLAPPALRRSDTPRVVMPNESNAFGESTHAAAAQARSAEG